MNRSDITGEQIGVFAMFLVNSDLKDILEVISEGDNAVIEYLHAMRLVDGSIIEIELAADLVSGNLENSRHKRSLILSSRDRPVSIGEILKLER